MSDSSNSSQSTAPFDIEAFRLLPSVRMKADSGYLPPTPEQVKLIRNYLGLSQTACAKLTGANFTPEKGSTTVRKWETSTESNNHKPIPYSAWRLMLVAAKVVDLDEDLTLVK